MNDRRGAGTYELRFVHGPSTSLTIPAGIRLLAALARLRGVPLVPQRGKSQREGLDSPFGAYLTEHLPIGPDQNPA